MGLLGHPSIQGLIASAQAHYASGNVVQLVVTNRSGADEDLGVGGTPTQVVTTITPEPFINAISIDAVLRNQTTFRFSDMRMTVAKSALTDEQATAKNTQFMVNGILYDVIVVDPLASSYEFVIRRKLP